MFNNLDNDFINTTGMTNPIIEEEIQNHKNKLNDLITKLINTHNIDDETFN